MEVKRDQFSDHVARVSAMLQNEFDISRFGPLVTTENFCVTIPNGPEPPFRKVTTDFGVIESALELPTCTQRHGRKYWIGLRELWQTVGKHKVRFLECSLRLYVGNLDQEPAHFLRLEWVAPEVDSGLYQGKHAGHPHWHIDRAVLAGNKTFLGSLEGITPDQNPPLEEFSSFTVSLVPAQKDLSLDCSWIQNIHLPAQAGWIKKWNGIDIPGPHQSEPDSFSALENWWTGALRYFVHELSILRI